MVTTHIGTVREGKVEIDPPLTLQEGSQVRVTLSPVLSEREAVGKANIWLAQNVGDAVGAMEGTFVEIDHQALWRFEAFITGTSIDPIGPIGSIDVDAESGQVLSTPKTVEDMLERGRQLALTP